jgi:hypothetical protein
MATTTNKGIILSGVPVAWIQFINQYTATISELWRFDNLQAANMKAKLSTAAAAGGSNVDINRSDGAIIRFPKDSLIISGIDETELTENAASGVDSTGLGEIILTTNEMPLVDAAGVAASFGMIPPRGLNVVDATWSEFVARLYANKDSLLLIAVPMGFSYDSRAIGGTGTADGYYYLICKLSSDIDLTANNTPMSLALTFVSYKITSSVAEATWVTNLQAATPTAITLKLGGSTISLSPPAITAAGAANLYDGIPFIQKDS